MTENKTHQQAGDAATQIGSVGGNVVQHINKQMGLWGCLAASIVAAGLFFCIVYAVEKIWPTDPQAGQGPAASSAVGFPVASSAVGSFPGGDFSQGANAYNVLADPTQVGHGGLALPSAGDQLQRQQLIGYAVQIMQQVNAGQAIAIANHDLALAALVCTGPMLQDIERLIRNHAQQGLWEQQLFENGWVVDARILSSDSWRTVLEIDSCEFWSSVTYNMAGFMVNSAPRHAVPQTMTVEITGGQPRVSFVNYAVSFDGCF